MPHEYVALTHFQVNTKGSQLFVSVFVFVLFCFLSFVILGPLPWHMEVPRLGVYLEL